MLSPIAMEKYNGIISVAVAVFDVSSVRKMIIDVETRMMPHSGNHSKRVTPLAIQVARPLAWNAAARDKPPPKRIRIPQRMSRPLSQSRANSNLRRDRGTQNAAIAAVMTIVASPTIGKKVWIPGMTRSPICFSLRNTKAMAVTPKIVAAAFSLRDIGPRACSCRYTKSRPSAILLGTAQARWVR